MSTTINPAISGAAGYTEAAYNSLIQQARTGKADLAAVDSLLFLAIQSGKSFTEARSLVESTLPELAAPNDASISLLENLKAMPSPAALFAARTTRFAGNQRRQNQEQMWQQTEAITASMRDEAKEMRSAAMTQLVMGVVSGALQIGMGLAQMGMGAMAAKSATAAGQKAGEKYVNDAGAKAGAKATAQGQTPQQVAAATRQGMEGAAAGGEKIASETFSSMLMRSNMTIGAVGQIGGGVARAFDAGAQYVNAEVQAKLKEMDADQEKMRSVRESTQALSEAMRELIQKFLAGQNDIQSSTNQANTRIQV
jgi:hypothetical protein